MAYLTSYDSRQLRNVLGTFTTGVTIVTTRDAQGFAHGVTANSFSSVSLEPPLVLWSHALTSRSFAAFRDSDHFAVNILADDQVSLSNHFAKSQVDKFANIEYSTGLGGVPVLQGTVAHFECVKVAAYTAGDHVIYLGRVERLSHSGRRPLAFAHGRYMVSYAHDLGPVSLQIGSAPVADVEAIRIATDALPVINEAAGLHTLCLAVWGNHGPTAIRWERGRNAITERLRAGLVMSITRTATGRAFAAFLPSEVTRAFIDEDLRLTRVADEDDQEQRQRFEDEIAEATLRGLARMADIKPSPLNQIKINAFSAPIFDQRGSMVMALSLAADAATLSADWNGPVPVVLAESARSLTNRIAAEGDHDREGERTG